MPEIEPIAYIHTDFNTKFGVPRQSGLCSELTGKIVFEPKFRNPDSLRGLSGFSHIWLIWGFSEVKQTEYSPTVRPPRLGGNKRVGVFAARSPFRPNGMGLSCVKLEKTDYDCPDAPVIYVSGIDMMNGTPIFDIKPYVPVTDCKIDATDGFTAETKNYKIAVDFPEKLLNILPESKRTAAVQMLTLDPRPSYISDESRIFGVEFAGFDIRFKVIGDTLTVTEIIKV